MVVGAPEQEFFEKKNDVKYGQNGRKNYAF